MQERLLNAYLAGMIDEANLAARQTQLRDEAADMAATLATCGDLGPEDVRTALGVFEFAQNAAQIWRGSKMDQKREILESVSLNRLLGDVTLVLKKRKPFDELAKRPEIPLVSDTAKPRTTRRFHRRMSLSERGDSMVSSASVSSVPSCSNLFLTEGTEELSLEIDRQADLPCIHVRGSLPSTRSVA